MSCICKKAIVLLGKPNSGKTTILHEVAKQLTARPGVTLINGARCLQYIAKVCADITVVVGINGKVILVRSCGDDEHEIVYTLKLIAKYRCDLAVFAVSMPLREGGHKAAFEYYREHQREIAREVVEITQLSADDKSQIQILNKKTTAQILSISDI